MEKIEYLKEELKIITGFLFHHTHNTGFQSCLDNASMLQMLLNAERKSQNNDGKHVTLD